ncbi:MAG: hypothetical protein ABEH38_09065 [Flavobacteriales bacterium]
MGILLGLMVVMSGCRKVQNAFEQRIQEGIIHYDITFPYAKEGGLVSSMLPDKMTMKFEKGRYVTEIKAGMGMFKMRILSNNKKKILHQTVDMMKEKLMVELNEHGAKQMLDRFPALKIISTPHRDTLGGLPCKKALGLFAPADQPQMDIYHTDRIALKNPNWWSQFHELDGVLMGYEVMRFGKRMRLRATKVEAKEIPDKAFSTKEYEKVSLKEMNKTMQKLMKSLE